MEGLVIMNLSIEKVKKLGTQFFKFGIVGFSNTIISLTVYYILVYFGVHYILANAGGFVVSVVNAFYWNNKYVFKGKTETHFGKLFSKVFLSYGASFMLSTCLIALFVEILRISEWIAPVLRLVVTVPLNFLFNKIWAFKDKG